MKCNLSGKLKYGLEQIDNFASPIGFTHNKNMQSVSNSFRMFRSAFGGAITILLVIGVSVYFAIRTTVLFNYGQTVSKQNEFIMSSNANTNEMSFSDNQFFFSVTIQDYSETQFFIDKKYGTFKSFLLITEKMESGSEKPLNVTPLYFSLSRCDNNTLYQNLISKSDQIKNYNLSNYLCPDIDLYLQGQTFSDRQVRPFIQYEVCRDKEYCANETEKELFYKKAIVSILIGDRWFDPDNYTSPLQTYFHSDWKPIREDSLSILQMYVQNNTVRLKDSLLGLSAEEFHFLKVDSKYNFAADNRGGGLQFNHSPNEIFRIILQLSHEKFIYERDVYSLNNLMSDVGGFFNSFFFIGATVFYIFQQQLFFASILPKVYFRSKNEKIKVQIDSERIGSGIEIGHESTQRVNQDNSGQNGQYVRILRMLSSIYSHTKFKNTIIAKISFKKLLWCFCKKEKYKCSTEQFYDYGRLKLIQELDLINFLQKIKKIDILYQLLLDPQMQVLGNISGTLLHKNEIEKTQSLVSAPYEIDKLKSFLSDNLNYSQRSSSKRMMKKLVHLVLKNQDQQNEEQSEFNIFEKNKSLVQEIQQQPNSAQRMNQTFELSPQNLKSLQETSKAAKKKGRTKLLKKEPMRNN